MVVTPINRPGHLFYMDTLRKGEDRFIPVFFFFFFLVAHNWKCPDYSIM